MPISRVVKEFTVPESVKRSTAHVDATADFGGLSVVAIVKAGADKKRRVRKVVSDMGRIIRRVALESGRRVADQ
jgi:hypothetical protein